MSKQETEQTNQLNLNDLPVTDERAEETRGGASGTGKTMAAEVLAHELRLDQ
ncbi:MAG: hypothetical protein AB1757_12695 [Acidobacteriota bacterium]